LHLDACTNDWEWGGVSGVWGRGERGLKILLACLKSFEEGIKMTGCNFRPVVFEKGLKHIWCRCAQHFQLYI